MVDEPPTPTRRRAKRQGSLSCQIQYNDLLGCLSAAAAAAKERMQAKAAAPREEFVQSAAAATLTATDAAPNGTIELAWDLGDNYRSKDDFVALRRCAACDLDRLTTDLPIRRAWTLYDATRYASSAEQEWRCVGMEPNGTASRANICFNHDTSISV